MKERINILNRFQKVILILLAVLTAAYAVAYGVAANRTGLVYRDEILLPLADGSGWSGKVEGEQITIWLTDNSVYCTANGKTYGPYTMVKDDSALPDSVIMGNMEGIEIRCGDSVFFRGGALNFGSDVWLESEDGQGYSNMITIYAGSPPEKELLPDAGEIYQLLTDPVIGHKGTWGAFLMGVFLCGVFAVSILFADELFRWHMSFSIRNAERAEPSDWEMATRYISWGIAPILVLILYAIGLGEIVT